MSERDELYVAILHFGLVSLRNAALQGKIHYCAIEAEHLHNVPSLIGESNEARHDYYFDAERPCYLEQVDRDDENVRLVISRYEELWQKLDDLRKSH